MDENTDMSKKSKFDSIFPLHIDPLGYITLQWNGSLKILQAKKQSSQQNRGRLKLYALSAVIFQTIHGCLGSFEATRIEHRLFTYSNLGFIVRASLLCALIIRTVINKPTSSQSTHGHTRISQKA